MAVDPKLLAALEALKARTQAPTDLYAGLFPEQRAFVDDESKYICATTSRRAGKTTAIAAKLLSAAIKHPGSVAAYFHQSRGDAKQLVLPVLEQLNETHKLGGVVNISDLTLAMPNGSVVELGSAKDLATANRKRGRAWSLVVFDEAQLIGSFLESFIDEAVVPGTIDFDGQVILTGTPPPVPTGPFAKYGKHPGWKQHHWNLFANPFLERKSGKTAQALLEAELKRRGVTIDDPGIQREWLGVPCLDLSALVFAFDPVKNIYAVLPKAKYRYVIGIDLGYIDSDAVVVLAYSPHSDVVWQVLEDIADKQTISDLVEKLQTIIASLGEENIQSIVIDAGGLGKKIQAEMVRRFKLNIKAAEKTEKLGYIELFNDALRTSKLKFLASSRVCSDAMLVEWDREKSNHEKLVISDRFHSDILDAALYAWRECLGWLSEPVTPDPPPLTSAEHAAATVERVRAEQASRFVPRETPREVLEKMMEEEQPTSMERLFGSDDDSPFNPW
jgi:hypothetical protein